MIEKTLLRSSKLGGRSIYVDHLLLLKGSRRLWSRFGARGRMRVKRLGGSGCRDWARRGLLPMSLSKGIVSMARDRACYIGQTNMNTYDVNIKIVIECMHIHECIQWEIPYSVPGSQVVFPQSAAGKQLFTARLVPLFPLAMVLAYSLLNVASEVGYPFGIVYVSSSRKGKARQGIPLSMWGFAPDHPDGTAFSPKILRYSEREWVREAPVLLIILTA
jgi:hypothetical protein